MNDQEGSYHVHMEDDPYCQSWSYHNEDTRMRSERAATLGAKDTGGVIVGPFDFDWSRCAYRRMMREESEQHRKKTAEHVSQDETIPQNERTMEKGYEPYHRRGLGSWHVHTDGDGWCRSFDSKRSAAQWIRDDAYRPKNPRIVGPLDYPAIACKYFHDNDPTYRAERKTS